LNDKGFFRHGRDDPLNRVDVDTSGKTPARCHHGGRSGWARGKRREVTAPTTYISGSKAAFGEKLILSPANTASEDFSEFGASGVPLMMFNIGVYDPDAWAAANKSGTPLPGNHSPLFAPVPKPTIQTGINAMTLAVLSAFEQRARGQ